MISTRRNALKGLTLGDAKTLQDAHEAYVDSDGSFEALVFSLQSSDSFIYREKSGS